MIHNFIKRWNNKNTKKKIGEIMEQKYSKGDIVYVLIRNPHVQDVANVQQAAIVQHPEQPNKLALFSHENYYPLSNDFVIFSTEAAAELAYEEAFVMDDGEKDG